MSTSGGGGGGCGPADGGGSWRRQRQRQRQRRGGGDDGVGVGPGGGLGHGHGHGSFTRGGAKSATTSTSTTTITTTTSTGGGGRWDALRGTSDRVDDDDGGGGGGSWRHHRRRRLGDGAGGRGGGGLRSQPRPAIHDGGDLRPRGARDERTQQPWRPRRRRGGATSGHGPPPQSWRGGTHGDDEFDNGGHHRLGAEDADSRFRAVTARLRRRLDLGRDARVCCGGGKGGNGSTPAPPPPEGGCPPACSAWNDAVATSVRDYRRIITLVDESPPPPWTKETVGTGTISPSARGEALAVLFGCLQRCPPPIAIEDDTGADADADADSGAGAGAHAGADACADSSAAGVAGVAGCEEGVVDGACRLASVLLLPVDDDVEEGKGGGRADMGRVDVRIAVTYLGGRCRDLVSSLRRMDDDGNDEDRHHRREEAKARAAATTNDGGAEDDDEDDVAPAPEEGEGGQSPSKARLVDSLCVALTCLRGFVVAFSPHAPLDEAPSSSTTPSSPSPPSSSSRGRHNGSYGGGQGSAGGGGGGGNAGGRTVIVGGGNRLGGGEFVADAVVRSALLPSLEWANGEEAAARVAAAAAVETDARQCRSDSERGGQDEESATPARPCCPSDTIALVALRTLTHLLRDVAHSHYSYPSAMLAPLVLDVCPTTGAERRVLPNPLKRRLVGAARDSFLLSVSSSLAAVKEDDGSRNGGQHRAAVTREMLGMIVAASCRALSALVEAAASLRGHRRRQRERRRLGGGGLGRGGGGGLGGDADVDVDVDVDVVADMDLPSVTGGLRSVLLLLPGAGTGATSSGARLAALGLLSSVVRNHPRVASSHWDEFLLEEGGRGRVGGCGGGGGGGRGGVFCSVAPLPRIIRGGSSTGPTATGGGCVARRTQEEGGERALAVRVAEEIVRALPLRLWLVPGAPPGGGSGRSPPPSPSPPAPAVVGAMGHLGRRVRSSLVDLAGCARAGLEEEVAATAAAADDDNDHGDEDDDEADAAVVVEGLCSLSSTLVTRVPFGVAGPVPPWGGDDDDEHVAAATTPADDDALLRSAVALLGSLGDLFVATAAATGRRRRCGEAAGAALIECAGGGIAPGGGGIVAPLPAPTGVWLGGEVDRERRRRRRRRGEDDGAPSTGSFLRALDELGGGGGGGSGRLDALEVLTHLARTAPWIVPILSVSVGGCHRRGGGGPPSRLSPARVSSACTRGGCCCSVHSSPSKTPRIIEAALSDTDSAVHVGGVRLVASFLKGRRDYLSSPTSSSAYVVVSTEEGVEEEKEKEDGKDGFPGVNGVAHDDDDNPFDFIWADLVPRLVFPALRDDDDVVRSGAVEAVGLLTASDWHRLFRECSGRRGSYDVVPGGGGFAACGGGEDTTTGEEEGGGSSMGLTLFRSVLGMCLREGGGDAPSCSSSSSSSSNPCFQEGIAGVRAAACRSTGGICTAVVGYDGRHCHPDGPGRSSSSCNMYFLPSTPVAVVTGHTADTMAIACCDPNPNVRTMAHFALGNLALAMASLRKEGDEGGMVPGPGPGPPLLSASTYLLLCRLCCDALNDDNDKVAGNAIRTMGHLINLWHKQNTSSAVIIESVSEIECDMVKLTEIAARNLTSKVDLALSEAAGTNHERLTWKQRSTVKRHAWGACHSLAFFLQGEIITTEGEREDIMCMQQAMIAAMEKNIHCIDQANSLNPKVTSAAVATLKSTPRDTWRLLSKGGTLVGEGIASCVALLFKRQEPAEVSSALLQEVRSLLLLFISLATASDYIQVIHSEESNPGQIGYLYQCMMGHCDEISSLGGNSFDVVGEALRRAMTTDVKLLQKFVSRGSMERRRKVIGGDAPQSWSKFDQGGDDEDEL